MPSSVRYRETLRMQRSSFLRLVGIFAASMAPLAVALWVFWRPLAAAAFALAWVAVAGVFWLARWQLEVRPDGLYYRAVPFLPVWRQLAAAGETVDVAVEHDANGRRRLDEEGKLFPWSTGTRTIAKDMDGGIRVRRADGTEVFVSSHEPDEFASALRSVAR